MDGLFVLLGLVVLAIPVAVVVLVVVVAGLNRRVRALEAKLANVAGTPAAPQPQAVVAVADQVIQAVRPPPPGPPRDRPVAAAPTPTAKAVEPPKPALQPKPPGPDYPLLLGKWLGRNWVYVVAAASLALAGVFLVQYGIENGILPPWARVFAAYLFGAALVAAGEWLRRRRGDSETSDTAYLPSVFAGAGIVSLFAATIAARQLYGLIGPNLAFALHGMTALLAIGLGWFYGPLLVAVGLIGAAAAPFLVGSDSAATPLLYGYYALVAAIGLATDAIRRWKWVSILALALSFLGGWAMLGFGAGEAGWIGFNLALVALAIMLPLLRVIPRHQGPSVLQKARDAKLPPIAFPTWVAAGTTLAASLFLTALPGETPLAGLTACAALTLLALALVIWAERAEGLADLAFVPAGFLLLRLVQDATQYWPLSSDFAAKAIDLRLPESAAPWEATWLVVMASLLSGAFAWRALRPGPLRLLHGLAAVLTAPVAVAILELFWMPARVVGAWTWALHAMVLAAAMVALAARFARTDGADRRRMAYATLSALSLISLSLFLLTSATALTLALAVLIVAAAWLDKRFSLREMGLFIQIAVVVLSYRLLIDPGLDWAMDAPVLTVILAFGGVVAGELAAFVLLRGMDRLMTRGVLESAGMAVTAVLANVLLSRWLVPVEDFASYSVLDLNYATSLNAMPWLVLMLTQAYRASFGGPLKRLRQVLAAVAGFFAASGLFVSAIFLNPLLARYEDGFGARIIGPWLLDTLALAYALPGLMLLVGAWRLRLHRTLRWGLVGSGGALLALYAGLEIRRFWQGDWLGRPGVTQYELYSYTVALMLVGAVLLYQAIARRSPTLRRIGMAVIAVTVAKVFLIDASGLTGLTRVISFLGLGLSLAGLAWLNRWAGQVSQKPGEPPPPGHA